MDHVPGRSRASWTVGDSFRRLIITKGCVWNGILIDWDLESGWIQWRLHVTPVGEAEDRGCRCNDRLSPELVLRAIEGVVGIRLVAKRKGLPAGRDSPKEVVKGHLHEEWRKRTKSTQRTDDNSLLGRHKENSQFH